MPLAELSEFIYYDWDVQLGVGKPSSCCNKSVSGLSSLSRNSHNVGDFLLGVISNHRQLIGE